jgi:hypothetical protein
MILPITIEKFIIWFLSNHILIKKLFIVLNSYLLGMTVKIEIPSLIISND